MNEREGAFCASVHSLLDLSHLHSKAEHFESNLEWYFQRKSGPPASRERKQESTTSFTPQCQFSQLRILRKEITQGKCDDRLIGEEEEASLLLNESLA